MTEPNAEKVANLLIGAAVLGAVFVILRNPSLRRSAWQLARGAAAAGGPWLMNEARRAWAETGAPEIDRSRAV